MKLSDEEKKVASCVFFRADLPLRAVSEETGLREHVARRCLDNLINRGTLRLRPFVNPFSIGLSERFALIGTHNMPPATRQRLITKLKESHHTTYVAAIGGDFHIAVIFASPSLAEAGEFLESVAESCGGSPAEIVTSECKAVTMFAPKFLGASLYGPHSLTYGTTDTVHKLDSVDHKILHSLESLTTPSYSYVARTLGIPVTTVSYRLESLKNKGILLALGYTVAPFQDDLFACAFQVHAAGMPREVKAKFVEFCAEHPAISFVIELIGAWTFQVGARLADPRQVVVLADQLQQVFAPYVTKVSSMSVHESIKLT